MVCFVEVSAQRALSQTLTMIPAGAEGTFFRSERTAISCDYVAGQAAAMRGQPEHLDSVPHQLPRNDPPPENLTAIPAGSIYVGPRRPRVQDCALAKSAAAPASAAGGGSWWRVQEFSAASASCTLLIHSAAK